MGHQHSNNEFKDRFVYEAQLVKVLDGGTIDVSVDLGFNIYHEIRLRLQGIDAPEIRGVEKVAGIASKQALQELLSLLRIEGFGSAPPIQPLFIETEKTDKYERYIATIWIPAKHVDADTLDGAYVETFNDEEWLNVNEYMVFHKFAKRYE